MRTFIFTSCFFLLASFSIQKKEDKIFWEDKKLSWDDFNGTKQVSYFKAYTFTEMGYNLSMSTDSAIVTIKCFFNPAKSWSSGDTSSYLLNHEQRHFDIAEYVSRKFKQAVVEYEFSSKQLFPKELNQLYIQHNTLTRTIQTTYDEESNHSLNKPMQEIWNTRVDSMLNETANIRQDRIALNIGNLK